MKESHFLSKNVFWKIAVLEFSNLCHCVLHPWKLSSRDFWSSRNKRKLLSKQKCVLRKCCGVSQNWWVLELSNHCHCVPYPWNLTSKDYWSSRNERKPLSQLNHVLRKCSRVSQKQWMPELSNLSHCVLALHEKLLVEISGALWMKESHFLSKNMFWENAVEYLRKTEC